MGALRKLMQDSRQLIRVFSTIRPKIVIRLLKGTGLILLPMIVAINTFLNPHLEIFHEVGTPCWLPRLRIWWCSSLEIDGSEAATCVFGKEEILFLMLIGSIIFGNQVTRPYFNTASTPATLKHTFARFKDTLEDMWLCLNWWVKSRERQFEEIISELGWWKSTGLGMSFCSSEAKIVLVSKRGWYQNGWKEVEYGSHVEEMDDKCGHRRTHIISWPRVLGMYSTWMQTKEVLFHEDVH